MNRSGKVYMKNVFCGVVSETDAGYLFEYNQDYLQNNQAEVVSLTLPLTEKHYLPFLMD